MRVNEKKKVISLLYTVHSAMEYSKKSKNNNTEYMLDSYEALKFLKTYISNKTSEYSSNNIEKLMNKISRYLYNQNCIFEVDFFDECITDLNKIIFDVKLNIKPKIKMIFLPYKASMWTSLESIWKAAKEDIDCEVTVLPIPYYELSNSGECEKICYEGELYPENVDVTKFWEYNIAEEKPDVIFIHNPYDDTNNLTRVLEPYYSRNLKKYTEKLVYSPYYTMIAYNDKDLSCDLEGVKYADNIIVQSETVKKIYEIKGYSKDKILALGSPKIDAIYNIVENPPQIPYDWKNKINNKNVFLLSTTLSFFVRFRDIAYKRVTSIYEQVVKVNGCVLIWRPHPLEEITIKNNLPELLPIYKSLIDLLESDPNVIIDKTTDYRPAFSIVKGMFCSYTSLINEFMVTGKPVFVIQGDNSKDENFLVSYRENYYLGKWKSNDFIRFSINENDPMYKERMKKLNKSFANMCDGSCGKKAYNHIKHELLKIENEI